MINLSELWVAIEAKVLKLIHKTEAIGCRVYNSGTQTITAGAWTALTWDTEVYDTDACWASGAPTQLVAARDGYYLAGGSYYLAAGQISSADKLSISVRKNGTTYLGGSDLHTISGIAALVGFATGMFWLSAGDYIQVCAWNDYAADKTVDAATATNQTKNQGWLMRVG